MTLRRVLVCCMTTVLDLFVYIGLLEFLVLCIRISVGSAVSLRARGPAPRTSAQSALIRFSVRERISHLLTLLSLALHRALSLH